MLWSLEHLRGYGLDASDGALGSVRDAFFDDREWIVRYLVVDTGGWLSGRRVLIVPSVLGQPNPERREIPVALTRKQVEGSPDIDTDKPIDRQKEAALLGHYGWPTEWLIPAAAGAAVERPDREPEPKARADLEKRAEAGAEHGDPHLRSARTVEGYHIGAHDGEVGHVEDFLIDEHGWRIRYLVVDTRNWLPGKRVLLSPDWVLRIDWATRSVEVGLTREQIRNSPEYDPDVGASRAYETRLYDHYARPPYW